MSILLSVHRIIDTFESPDVEKRNLLVKDMAYNLKHGAFTTVGCSCDKCKEIISNKENELNVFWLEIIDEAKTKLKS